MAQIVSGDKNKKTLTVAKTKGATVTKTPVKTTVTTKPATGSKATTTGGEKTTATTMMTTIAPKATSQVRSVSSNVNPVKYGGEESGKVTPAKIAKIDADVKARVAQANQVNLANTIANKSIPVKEKTLSQVTPVASKGTQVAGKTPITGTAVTNRNTLKEAQSAQMGAFGKVTEQQSKAVRSALQDITGKQASSEDIVNWTSVMSQSNATPEQIRSGIQKAYDTTGKTDIKSAIDSGAVNQAEEQPVFDAGEYTTGEPTGVEVTADDLKAMAESFMLQSDPETGTGYYVSSDGTVLTQEQYQSMLGRIDQAVVYASQFGGGTGLRFGTVSPADYTGGGAVGMPTEVPQQTVSPAVGAGQTGRVVPNSSDSNNITASSSGTSTLDPIAGSVQSSMAITAPSGVYGDQAFFSNPYFEKLAQMQFDYDPNNDPEYLNNSAILENAVTQAMVGRGGMYSSVYQSALSSKLIELQIGMRKAKYDQFVDERNFMLNMAKTTFDMQMSVANYAMDYQKMAFDQEMTVRKYEADRADAEFSKQMQRNEYALSVAKYNREIEKDNAYNTLMVESEQYKFNKTQQERLLSTWKANKVATLEVASYFGVPLNTVFDSSTAVKAYSSKARALSTAQKSIVDRSTALGDYETLQLALNDFIIPSSGTSYTGTSAENSSPDQLVATTAVLSGIKDSSSAFKVEEAIQSNPTMYYNQLGFYGYQQVLKRIDDMTSGMRG